SYAINSAGQVVGEAQAADGNSHPFVWTPCGPNGTTGTMINLSAYHGVARGINNSGVVVGDVNGQPVRWDSSGVAHTLSLLSGCDAGSAYAINNAGEIVGFCSYLEQYIDAEGYVDYYYHTLATLWDSAGAVHDLNALSSAGGLA